MIDDVLLRLASRYDLGCMQFEQSMMACPVNTRHLSHQKKANISQKHFRFPSYACGRICPKSETDQQSLNLDSEVGFVQKERMLPKVCDREGLQCNAHRSPLESGHASDSGLLTESHDLDIIRSDLINPMGIVRENKATFA